MNFDKFSHSAAHCQFGIIFVARKTVRILPAHHKTKYRF